MSAIVPPSRPGLPVSAAQRRAWTLEQRTLGPGYNVCFALELPGTPSLASVREALGALIRRHEAFHHTLAVVGGELRMLPDSRGPQLDEQRVDEAGYATLYQHLACRRQDLAVDPPLSGTLARIGERSRLILVGHHASIDGTTLPVVCAELARLLAGEALAPVEGSQAAVVAVEQAWLSSDAAEESRAWWRAQLKGMPAAELPGDRRPGSRRSGAGSLLRADLSAEDAAALGALARARGCTPFRALVACVQALLLRARGVAELPVGITTHGRWHPDWRGRVGMFTNPVLLRLPVDPEQGLGALLERSQQTLAAALDHGRLPYDEVVRIARELGREGDPFRTLIGSQVSAAAINQALPAGYRVLLHALDTGGPGSARMDLKLSSAPLPDGGLQLEWELDRELLDTSTVQTLAENLRRLVRSGAEAPDCPIDRLPLTASSERPALRALLTGPPAPESAPVMGLIAEWPAASTAVTFGAERLSYGELREQVRRIAGGLTAAGAERGEVIGLLMQRRPAAIAAMLGVLSAGAAWLPLEPDTPAHRLEAMLTDAEVRRVVCDPELAARLPGGVEPLRLEALLSAAPLGAPRGEPEDRAYVLFTSGSTGRPKGVGVSRSALRHLLAYSRDLFGMRSGDVVAALATWSFDISLAELILPLTCGATVRLLDRRLALDPATLAESLLGVDVAQATPTTWSMLARRGWRPSGLRVLSSTGEALPPDLAQLLATPGLRLLNLYGPTETTVWASGGLVDPAQVDIGRPLPGLCCPVMDPGGQPVPPGILGELYIGGPSVAEGYLGRPELTAARFVPDPDHPGERLYRSGDLARARADGRLECLGRLDDQLKVRGHRVEPGELEAALREHPQIAEAAAALAVDPSVGEQLVAAYVCVAAGADPGDRALRDHLAARLPVWMLPARLVALAALPRTTSGKVDRRAVAEAAQTPPPAPALVPRDLVDRIAAVQAEVIGLPAVDPERSVLEQGAGSLHIVVMRERLAEALGLEVSVPDLFDHPSAVRLAAHLAGEQPRLLSAPTTAEPIAVVGIACRLPGGVDSPGALLALLSAGQDAIEEVPPSRWDAQALYEPAPSRPGRLPTRWGGFIHGIEDFDPAAFGLTPREAQAMDPQHRLLLELSREAVEGAGYAPSAMAGTETGVFVGLCGTDYQGRAIQRPALEAIDPHAATGTAHSVAAGRVAHLLDLRGPAVVVDTACSSSLVALHLACQALRSGECESTLVAGVNAVLSPRWGAGFSGLGLLSPTGRCQAFGAGADGYVRSDGGVALLLKPLSAAQAAGDTIHGVIRSTAINHDGRAASLTAPSGPAQQRVIRQALQRAGLHPDDIDLVEAHGTGTELGDPIEVQALATTFGPHRERPLLIGSIKSNIGHCEGASGLAGLLKALLSVREGQVFQTLHTESLNPHLAWDRLPLAVARQRQPWPAVDRPRRAGVSSFGFSGTNAHAIIEQAPSPPPAASPAGPSMLRLSARSPELLEELVEATAAWIAAHPEQHPADLAWTFAVGRDAAPFRRVLWLGGSPPEALRAQGEAWERGAELPLPPRGRRVPAPTSPFQRRTLRLEEPLAGGVPLPHPVLRSRQILADGVRILEGRASLAAWPALGDHRVEGAAVLPATWILELARAGGADALGSETVELREVGLFAPCVLPAQGTRRLQLSLRPSEDGFAWALASRPETEEGPWVRHAAGSLHLAVMVPGDAPEPPPPDAGEPAKIYARFAELGVDYGPAYRGLVGIEQRAEHLTLRLGGAPAGLALLDPRRMDAALQGLAWSQVSGPEGTLMMPFKVRRAVLSPGLPVLARVQPEPGEATVEAFDDAGHRLALIEGLALRAAEPSGVSLSRLAWEPMPLSAAAWSGRWALLGESPALTAALERLGPCVPVAEADTVILVPALGGSIEAALRGALAALRRLLQLSTPPQAVLCLSGGLGPDASDPAAAAVAGLWRVVRAEHPELRARVIDHVSTAGLAEALATDEPELLLRDGAAFTPRLVRDPHTPGTVSGRWLVTGATGGLGGAVARHLASRGAEVVLSGRQHPDPTLLQETGGRFLQADLVEPGAVARLLEAAGPLDGVVHAAGALTDGTLSSLDDDAFGQALAAKTLAAQALCAALPPETHLVLFSSVSAWLGAAGQATYVAANAALEALAVGRQAAGGRAVAVAWGPWAELGMAARLGAREQARATHMGLDRLSPRKGLALLDAALATTAPVVGAFLLDLERARASLGARRAPSWLGGRRAPSPTGTTRLDRAALQALIRELLALDPRDTIDWSQPFQELGLDSLMAVELRDRLSRATGRELPATLLFEQPDLESLARWLGAEPAAAPPAPALAEVPRHDSEPIAIVGIGCRFPGGIEGADDFWRLLVDGVDAVGPVPPDRWDRAAWHDPTGRTPGRTVTDQGGFIDDPWGFEPGFFGLTPGEARLMDPQQRILLEVAWEAFADAGLPPSALRGSLTGVYLGFMNHDHYLLHGGQIDRMDGRFSVGNSAAVAAGRLSYHFGLIGPAMTLDTACSSALVAAHLAAQGLRRGECDAALIGGIALVLQPGVAVEFSQLQAMSPDGRCRSFSASAQGVGWSEGCGLLVLKRLSDARRDGDRIYGVIRGSAVNQDGRSNGLTAPSGPAQEAVLRRALRDAGLRPEQVDYVETHGTGTALGDPIEAMAIGAIYGDGRDPATPIHIGSVKTNLAHTQAAAGAAGMIKVLLSMQHDLLPRQLHFDAPSPHVPWDRLAVAVVDQDRPWQRGDQPRRAGVSSFGVSGTNGHVLLEDPPASPAAAVRLPLVLPLSAPDGARLALQAGDIAAALRGGAMSVADLLHTAARRRFRLAARLAIVAPDTATLLDALDAASAGGEHPALLRGHAEAGERRVAFVFPGQGAQWAGMARELMRDEPVFRDTVEACDRAIAAEAGWSVAAWLAGADEDQGIDRIQPALFTVSAGLTALWRSWGVEPAVVLGHSQGEVAAAWACGALTLADAVAVIVRRSALMRRLAGGGAMLVTELTPEEAADRLRPLGAAVALAVINGPRSTVLSGDPAVVAELAEALERDKIFHRFVGVDVASHSPAMDPIRASLLEALEDLRPGAPVLPMRSTVTTHAVTPGELDAAYWWSNLRRPVRFGAVIAELAEDRDLLFLELSAHPLLVSAVGDLAPGRAVGTLRREQPERESLARAAMALWLQGLEPSWDALVAPARVCSLPRLRFQRERLKLDWGSMERPGAGRRAVDSSAHPLLPVALESAAGGGWRYWQGRLSLETQPWLSDHRVGDAVLLPGAAVIELALQASGGAPVSAVRFEDALVIDRQPREVQLAVSPAGDFTLSSRADGGPWLRHACGQIAADLLQPPDLAPAPAAAVPETPESFYARMAAASLHYGPAFQGIVALQAGDQQASAELHLPPAARGEYGFWAHPALLDAALQVLAAAVPEGLRASGPVVPTGVQQIRPPRAPLPEQVQVRAWWRAGAEPGTSCGDLQIYGLDGELLLGLYGLEARELIHAEPTPLEARSWLSVSWQPAELSAAPADQQAPAPLVISLHDQAAPAAPAARALSLVAALLERLQGALELPDLREVVLITRGALEADGVEVDPAQRAAVGLVRSFATEHPELRVRRVDLDPRRPAEAQRADLERLLRDPGAEDELALRAGVVLVPRLQRRLPGRVTGRPELLPSPQPGPGELALRPLASATGGFIAEVTSCGEGVLGTPAGARVIVSAEHPVQQARAADCLLLPEGWTPEDGLRLALPLLRVAHRDLVERALAGPPPQGGAAVDTRPLAPMTRRVRADAPFSGEGWWLITGGLGGLGLSVAEGLVERGVRGLALLGRSGAVSASQHAAVAALRARGAEVLVFAVDVSDRPALASVIDHAEQALGRLVGVVHAAGVLDDGLLRGQDTARLAKVFAPKVQGAWNLHELTLRRAPLHFVLYSSGASMLGSPGQSTYAAANAFLDGLAHARRSQGLPALSINWGAFSEVGLAAAQANRGDRLASKGLEPIRPADGLAMLLTLLATDTPQVGVLPFDAARWFAFLPQLAGSPRFSALHTAAAEPEPEHALLAVLAGKQGARRRSAVEDYVGRQLAAVLGVRAEELSVRRPLNELGLDSLAGLELRTRLEAASGLRLSATMAWSYPTIEAIAGHLLALLAEAPEPAPAPTAIAPKEERLDLSEALLSELDADELGALLDAELDALEDRYS